MTGTARMGKKRLMAGLAFALGATAIAGPSSSQGAPVSWESGDIIVADSLDQQVEAVNPETGVKVPVSTGGNFVLAGIAFDGDGNILVVDRDAFGGKGGVIRIDKGTNTQTVVSNNAISDAAGGQQRFSDPIAIDRKGDFAYVTDFGGKPSRVVKVNLTTGKQTLLSGGKNIGDPLGIDTSLKHALVADAGSRKSDLRLRGGLIQVDLDSGKQKVIAEKGDLEDLGDVVAESKESALAIDSGAFNFTGAMFRIDLDTGKTKTIFKGGEFVPAGLAVESRKTAYITRALNLSGTGALYEVDLKSGDRTLLNGSGFNNPLGLEIAP
jgi:sugar lactone lactonase YvrE